MKAGNVRCHATRDESHGRNVSVTRSPGIEEIFDRVGLPVDLFVPPIWRLAVGAGALGLFGVFFISLGLLGGGAPPERLWAVVCGIIPLAIAGVILIYAIRRRKLRVLLCPEAIVLHRHNAFEVFPWDQIVAVRETKQTDEIYYIPLGIYRAAEIAFADGRTEFFDRNRIRRVGDFIDSVQREVWRRHSTLSATASDARLARLISVWSDLSEATRERLLSIVDEDEP